MSEAIGDGEVAPYRAGYDGVRETRRGSEKGQLAWRGDELIMERIKQGERLWAQKLTEREAARVLNELMPKLFPNEAEHRVRVSQPTVHEDRARMRVLWAEAPRPHKKAIIAEAENVIQMASRAFQSTAGNSLNRQAYLGTMLRAIEFKAKLEGMMVERVEFTTDVARVRAIIDASIPDEGLKDVLAMKLLGLDGPAGEDGVTVRDVVDTARVDIADAG